MKFSRKGQFFPYRDEPKAKSFPYITIALIVINVAIFLWSLLDFENIINRYGFTPAHVTLITIFTSMFLHGGFDHIFGNMWFLWIFGDNVEDRFGKIKYILFYIASGVAATFVHWLSDPNSNIPSIGASGAISGVLGAYLVFYPKAKVYVGGMYGGFPLPAYVMLGFWFVLQFIFGAMSLVGGVGSGIAFWAHVGGFVFGAIVALVAMKLGMMKK